MLLDLMNSLQLYYNTFDLLFVYHCHTLLNMVTLVHMDQVGKLEKQNIYFDILFYIYSNLHKVVIAGIFVLQYYFPHMYYMVY